MEVFHSAGKRLGPKAACLERLQGRSGPTTRVIGCDSGAPALSCRSSGTSKQRAAVRVDRLQSKPLPWQQHATRTGPSCPACPACAHPCNRPPQQAARQLCCHVSSSGGGGRRRRRVVVFGGLHAGKLGQGVHQQRAFALHAHHPPCSVLVPTAAGKALQGGRAMGGRTGEPPARQGGVSGRAQQGVGPPAAATLNRPAMQQLAGAFPAVGCATRAIPTSTPVTPMQSHPSPRERLSPGGRPCPQAAQPLLQLSPALAARPLPALPPP